ncbi:DNRLRE domain-containing protein [Streptomyces spongiae]|uniref:DNRLRE domain-containing protein n=1 Tax=Streptomyces spongiae TaxID=565072 RepID=A0A5N8XD31_9ACTN|nr:DNRLRE domain-containing protein [Streptomyces spongiae]MPY56808.1 DNRLRE domain-containing protein [Streptomyces spongiae]
MPASRRARAGVAALIAGALGLGLLTVPLLADPDPSDPRADTKKSASRPVDQDTALERAVSSGKRVAVTALHDETSTTYARPDGRFELVAYGAPVRAKVNGAWKPIDTELVEVDGGWAPKAAADPVVFSEGGDGAIGGGSSARKASTGTTDTGGVRSAVYTVANDGRTVRTAADAEDYTELAVLNSGGHEVTLSWPGELPEPVISGASALYRNVFDGVDLLLTAQASGFSHVLIVHSAEAAADPALTKLSYGLSSPDLTFRLDPVTKVVTGRNRDGEDIAVSPTPYLWDSAGKFAVTEGDDPEPTEEDAEPAPSYSEEPGAEPGEESAAPEDGLDTDAPAEASADPAAYRSVSKGNGSLARAAHAGTRAVRTGLTTALTTALTDDEVFDLPGLAGADPGTHLALADAELSAPGTGSTGLSLVPDADLLGDKDTVYPVFIDPTIYGKSKNWTTAYKKYPNSSFYDGANYNSGTTEARVGYESTSWGLSRSYFRLGWSTSIKGAHVSSASIRLRETYSWSCQAREMKLFHTGGISSKTTWNNQPDKKAEIGAKSFSHGYNSSCPDAYVTYDAKSVAQDAADGGWKEFTIGLQASTEDSAYSWKKFRAEGESAPKLTLVYNRKPKTPSSLAQAPGGGCDRTSPYIHVGKRDLTLSAASSDADDTSTRKDLEYLDFELWRTGYGDDKILDKNVTVTSAGKASATIAKSKFTNGHQYSWRVRAIDSSGAASPYAPTADPGVCRFIFDSSVPNEPIVASTDYPAADEDGSVWSKVKFGTAGNFTFAPDEDTDITKFEWSFNTTTYASNKAVAAGASLTLSLKTPNAGPNVLYVRAVDSAGNPSLGTKYLFYVTPRDTGDKPGDVTGDAVPDLFAITSAGNLNLYPAVASGDLHAGMEAAHDNGTALLADPDEDGEDHKPGYWMGADGKPALIAHGGDATGADGVGDLFARMPDGELYVYPGDGYGSVDISGRMKVRMPSGAPDPSTLTQIIVGDYDSDGRADLFATDASGALWAFEGYTGVTFLSATKMASAAWTERDLVSVGTHDTDDAPDLVWRSGASSRLYIRFGVEDSAGGSTLASLSAAANSKTGADEVYAEGWPAATVPATHVFGSPDVTGDGIPDIWALASDGTVKFHKGGAATLGAGTAVISAASEWATTKLTFG